MAGYTLDAFSADCTANARQDKEGRERIRRDVEKLLGERKFIEEHFGPGAEPGIRPLYTDAETGYQILAHVYAEGKQSPPHDHGVSWAVYGQAVGQTEMTVWRRVDDGAEEGRAEVEIERSFRLDPGMAGTFEPGEIHSIKFPAGARFLRVTGADLKTIPTRRFDPEAKTVIEDAGISGVVR